LQHVVKSCFSVSVAPSLVPSAAPTKAPTAPTTPAQYCANILPNQADGASGFAALQIAKGQAKYDFTLNLENFATTCNLAMGLKYHVHSYWNNATSNSASGSTLCGAAIAGGHYDPNFACSVYSQEISTGCVELNRVTPNYYYACNSSLYNQGSYSYCEVGDTSGKNGIAYPLAGTTATFALSTPFVDYQPLYNANYMKTEVNALPWASFVFHCAENAARLVCGKFTPTDLTACQPSFTKMNVNATQCTNSTAAPSVAPSVSPVR
jgi:hypothetical protein